MNAFDKISIQSPIFKMQHIRKAGDSERSELTTDEFIPCVMIPLFTI